MVLLIAVGALTFSGWVGYVLVLARTNLLPAEPQPTKLELVGKRPDIPRLDVVFIHGMGGGVPGTWKCEKGDFYWPEKLAGQLPDIAVWVASYDASKTAWEGNAMRLTAQSLSLLSRLKSKQIGERGIVFVGHSYGGNLVQQMLADTFGRAEEFETIGLRTRGVVFVATPVSGSEKANIVGYLASVMKIAGVSEFITTDIATENSGAAELARDWYEKKAEGKGIETLSFYEHVATPGVGIVVDKERADPHSGGMPIGIQANHITIAKPCSLDSEVFEPTQKFIQKILTNGEYPHPFASFAEDLATAQSSANSLRDFWNATGNRFFNRWEAEIASVNEAEKQYFIELLPTTTGIRIRAIFAAGFDPKAKEHDKITFSGFIQKGGLNTGRATLDDCQLLKLVTPKAESPEVYSP